MSEEKKKVYFNAMQREVTLIGARDNVIVAGRGTGKGVLHAAINLRNMQAMPGSTTAFVVPNTKRGLTNTLPSMFVHWESWGFKRDIHFCVGHRPPKRLGWPKPIYEPDNWENFISFYTGAVGQIISQDRTGTSNSISFDFLDIDEAKFVDFDQLKNETFQANRGQQREFGHLSFHHGMLVTSDMPLTKKGSWFLNYAGACDEELITMIQALIAEIAYSKQRLGREGCPIYMKERIRDMQRKLEALRSKALLYRIYSSLTNMHVLGEDYIRKQKRDLPPLIFQTSILCIPVEILADGFYSSMRPTHKYRATDFHQLDMLGIPDKPVATDCRYDADLNPELPLCIAFDWNANINWLVVGQADYREHRLNVLKSFFVKYERKIPELIADFCLYYQAYQRREVIFYYDATALGSNYAVNNQDFQWVVAHELLKQGWKCRPVYIGRPMNHVEKHLLINRAFSGQTSLMPFFNEDNNEYLLISIQTAGVYNGKKDKRGEKLAETEEDKLEARTDGSDAFDTLFIGCEKFPQQTLLITVTSDL